jgi:hypothetical protein
MSNLRWSNEVSAVVDENDTIVYVVSSEVGAMIVGYQRQMDVIRTQTTVSARQVALIADLRAALTDAQAAAAVADGKLAEATRLLEAAHDRIAELEQCFDSERQRHHLRYARIPMLMARIAELEAQLAVALTTIEAATSDGALYAEGCAP